MSSEIESEARLTEYVQWTGQRSWQTAGHKCQKLKLNLRKRNVRWETFVPYLVVHCDSRTRDRIGFNPLTSRYGRALVSTRKIFCAENLKGNYWAQTFPNDPFLCLRSQFLRENLRRVYWASISVSSLFPRKARELSFKGAASSRLVKSHFSGRDATQRRNLFPSWED